MNVEKRLQRYATLLRLRERQEDERAKAFARERATQAALVNDRAHIDARQRALLQAIATMAADRPQPRKLYAAYQYERFLGRTRDARDSAIAKQQEHVDAAREELESAIGERRIMEKLIERTEAARDYAARRREQRLHDEISVMRYARASRLRVDDENSVDSDSGHRGVRRGPDRTGDS